MTVNPQVMTRRVQAHIPPMSAQHFFFIAETMATIEAERPSKNVVVEALADRLALTNPNFKRDFFIEACNRTNEETT